MGFQIITDDKGTKILRPDGAEVFIPSGGELEHIRSMWGYISKLNDKINSIPFTIIGALFNNGIIKTKAQLKGVAEYINGAAKFDKECGDKESLMEEIEIDEDAIQGNLSKPVWKK